MIEAQQIHKSYKDLHVLKGVNLNIPKGEIVSIVGASGAGKTTLLQILGTLDLPDRKHGSTLRVNDTDIYSLSPKELSRFRNRNIGFIFQFHQLLPEFTALENVCIPAYINNTSKETSTANRPKTFTSYSSTCGRSLGRPLLSSPTTRISPIWPTESSQWSMGISSKYSRFDF